jgi:hypothetical protein
VLRLPRLRRRRLRERPINASNEPVRTGRGRLRPRLRRPRLPQPRLPRVRRPRPLRRLRSIPRGVAIGAGVVALLGAGAAAALATGVFESDDESRATVAPAPPLPESAPAEERPVAEAAARLGFPAFATKNTTRVGGVDPTADAAGVALATYPSAGGVESPVAVTLVGEDDWPVGIAASVLMAEPVRAPLLLSTSDGVPEETEQALAALAPEGGAQTDGAQVFALGEVEAPDGLQTTRIRPRGRRGGGPAVLAAAVERLRARLTGRKPRHIVLAPLGRSAFAMPAAAWAARSGDPVLFATRQGLPKATTRILRRHRRVPVYVLGPASAISAEVVRRAARIGGVVRRVSGEDPVTNAIEFARYADGDFGWNINDPGHGFVLARSDRPLDAAAAAPLSASGTWGPLLLTDSADTLPGALRGYLLDVKPGYRTDPTRAFYNHVWIIGDQDAIDVSQQAAIDELAELARIRPSGGR